MNDRKARLWERTKAVLPRSPQPPPRIRIDGADQGIDGTVGVLLCVVLSVFSLVIIVAGRLTGAEALSLSGGFGVVFFGVGAAPFQILGRLDIYARLTGAMLVGLCVLLGGGALMVDIRPFWHPVAAAIIVAVVAAALHVVGLLRVRSRIRSTLRSTLADWQLQARSASQASRASLILTGAGTILWLVPALTTHDSQPGIWGLLSVISPAWYAGFVLVVAGFVLGRRGELTALASSVSFGLASTLSPALVYATPRQGTAAKHLVITQYVLTHHHLSPSAGIYQAFSALFSGMAWLCDLIHVHGLLGHDSLLGLATYWPAIILLPRVFALRMFAGRLVSTPGRSWIVVMLVLLVDTINDANYFSPQSAGYLMSIGILAFAVNGETLRPLSRRATVGLLALAGVTLALTHELTPYLTLTALFILFLFGQAPWWSWVTVGIPALGWAAVVRKAIGANFSFGQLFDLKNLVPPKTAGEPGLLRSPAIGYQSHALLLALLILIGLAAIGFFSTVRTRRSWAYGLCPMAGIALTLVNPYGNEGIFRASLFAIPWLAVLAMRMPHPGLRIPQLRRPLVLSAVLGGIMLALLGTFIVALYGVDGSSVLWRSDVAVADRLQATASKNASVLSVGAANDTAVYDLAWPGRYATYNWVAPVVNRMLLDAKRPDSHDLTVLTTRFLAVAGNNGTSGSGPLYIFWSGSTLVESSAYAVQSPLQMEQWLRVLRASRKWRLVARSGDSYLFKLRQ